MAEAGGTALARWWRWWERECSLDLQILGELLDLHRSGLKLHEHIHLLSLLCRQVVELAENVLDQLGWRLVLIGDLRHGLGYLLLKLCVVFLCGRVAKLIDFCLGNQPLIGQHYGSIRIHHPPFFGFTIKAGSTGDQWLLLPLVRLQWYNFLTNRHFGEGEGNWGWESKCRKELDFLFFLRRTEGVFF